MSILILWKHCLSRHCAKGNITIDRLLVIHVKQTQWKWNWEKEREASVRIQGKTRKMVLRLTQGQKKRRGKLTTTYETGRAEVFFFCSALFFVFFLFCFFIHNFLKRVSFPCKSLYLFSTISLYNNTRWTTWTATYRYQSLWRRANARNFSFFTLYGG